MYYYGQSTNNATALLELFTYLYIGDTKCKLPFASPFQLKNFQDVIAANLTGEDTPEAIYASYVRSIYIMLGDEHPFQTNYSLVFGDMGKSIGSPTLYDVFYYNMLNRYSNSEILDCEMIMNSYDWQQMQINRAIQINGELYSIIDIKNYDIIKNTATLKLIKMI